MYLLSTAVNNPQFRTSALPVEFNPQDIEVNPVIDFGIGK